MEINWSSILIFVLVGFYLYQVFSSVMVLLLENRNPIRSIAWVIVLLFLPFIGLLFYFVFGQNNQQKKKIHKLSLRKKQLKYKNPFDKNIISETDLPEKSIGLIRLLYNNNKALVYENSKVEVFYQQQPTFDAMFADMEQATDHLHVEFFIIGNDVVGNRLRKLLIRKAKEGVSTRLIFDYWGSLYLDKKYLRSMEEAGVQFYAFYPPKFPFLLSKVNYRNHRKIIVVDGKVAYTGGINMADRYLTGDSLGMWRDTMVRIEGAAVHGLQETFLSDWFFVDRNLLTGKRYFPESIEYEKNLIQIVDSGPNMEFQSIMQGIYFAISTSKKYVYIQTPYFLPPDVILVAIQTAAQRGVDVRILIPTSSDSSMARAGNASYVAALLQTDVRVFLYKNGFLHSKTIVVDDEISIIGTANMDFRSYEQNFEVNAFIYEGATAKNLREIFINDLASSEEITSEEWEKRPKIERIKESFSRLLSPVM